MVLPAGMGYMGLRNELDRLKALQQGLTSEYNEKVGSLRERLQQVENERIRAVEAKTDSIDGGWDIVEADDEEGSKVDVIGKLAKQKFSLTKKLNAIQSAYDEKLRDVLARRNEVQKAIDRHHYNS